jgi:uncharacterized protein YjdB
MAEVVVKLNYTPVNGKQAFVPDVNPLKVKRGDAVQFQLGNAPAGAEFQLRFNKPSLYKSAHNRVQNSGLHQSGDGDLQIVGKSGDDKYVCRLFQNGKELPTEENPGGDVIISDDGGR